MKKLCNLLELKNRMESLLKENDIDKRFLSYDELENLLLDLEEYERDYNDTLQEKIKKEDKKDFEDVMDIGGIVDIQWVLRKLAEIKDPVKRRLDEIDQERKFGDIDPVEYDLLLHTLQQLQKEVERLKNRLDFVEPKKQVFENNHKKNIDLNIPVEEWNCQHFIRYFLQQYKSAYKKDYSMQPSAWSLEAFKITAFWRRHPNLTKEYFKSMIDWLFETAAENFEIKMGLMTSDNQLKNFENFSAKNGKSKYDRVEIPEEELKKDIKEQTKTDITSDELKSKLKESLGKE